MDNPNKDHLNIVFLGNVDSGKSNLCGHLLYLMNAVDPRILEKCQREAVANNRASWVWSYIMDTLDEERARGKTIDISRAYFETDKRRYTILDAPGHRNYIPNMISGTAQADVAILLVSAKTGEFEAGFNSETKQGQTREHALLAKMMGIKYLIVAVNKMDESNMEKLDVPPDQIVWNQQRYDKIVSEMKSFLLKECQFGSTQVKYIPISAYHNLNLIKPVPKEICSFYDGLPLLSILDNLPTLTKGVSDPLRLAVSNKFKDQGNLYVIGKLEAGSLRKNDIILLMPRKIKVKVTSLMIGETLVETANMGDNLILTITGCEENDILIGDVLCDPNNPISVTKQCIAQIKLIDLPPTRPIFTAGYSAKFHLATSVRECTIMELVEEIDPQTKKQGLQGTQKCKKKKPPFARVGALLTVKISLDESVCLELFEHSPYFGRFTLRDEDKTLGIGKIVSLSP